MRRLALVVGFSSMTLCGQPANPVIQWNRTLLTLLRTPGVQPAAIHPTRNMAILHVAILGAINAAPTVSQEAVVDAAAHTVLLSLYPSAASTIEMAYAQSLAAIPDGPDKEDGIRAGELTANQALATRSHDGSSNPAPVITFDSSPGVYQSTPPNFPAPAFTGWLQVTPFTLTSASQFRPPPPPALSSQAYSDALNEVRSVGIPHSPAASIDQQLTGWFWNGPIQNYWNEIAQSAAIEHNLTTSQTAQLFATLNVSLADTVIAFYDAKYTYKFWRPVTAIRSSGDSTWLPETKNTAADPSYPGAHSAISSAAATVLGSFFGSDRFSFQVTSEVFAGVQRSFQSFSAAAEEAGLSRIYAGQHFRFDHNAGQQLGADVAHQALTYFTIPGVL
ncbi:MAG TPA: vanadium-dependent haloperoxidase [Bryobacteraceae bacterium]